MYKPNPAFKKYYNEAPEDLKMILCSRGVRPMVKMKGRLMVRKMTKEEQGRVARLETMVIIR